MPRNLRGWTQPTIVGTIIAAIGAAIAFLKLFHPEPTRERPNVAITQGLNSIVAGTGNITINQIVREDGITAERYTNIRAIGANLFVDYIRATLHPDGRYEVNKASTPGVNLNIPPDVLYKIQGRWVIEKSDIVTNPNRKLFRYSKIAEFDGRVVLAVDF